MRQKRNVSHLEDKQFSHVTGGNSLMIIFIHRKYTIGSKRHVDFQSKILTQGYQSSGWTLKLQNMKVSLKKPEISLYHTMWNVDLYWYLQPRRRGSRVWQTNGRTNRQYGC